MSRTLPALVAAAALAAALTFGLGAGHDASHAHKAVRHPDGLAHRWTDLDILSSLYLGQITVLPDRTVTATDIATN